ncbi:MAG: response regulator [Myxococcota bacterium]
MSDTTRVLIVDDEPVILQVLQLALRDRGWEIVTADSGEKALEICADREFDIYILDKNLPGISGIEVVARVRETDPEACCVIITAFASAESAAEALNLDVDAYVEKPFENIVETADRIERILRTRLRRRQAGSTLSALDHFERATQNLRKISRRPQQTRRLKILVAGLGDGDRQIVDDNLGSNNDEFLVAETSAKAREVIRRGGLDLLVVDAAVRDPAIDELLDELGQHNPGAECAVLCSRVSLETLTAWIDAGVKALLEQPLTAAVFKSRIRSVQRRLRLLPAPSADA